MKVNDLFTMESVYNQRNQISSMIANLRFPQKYLNLEYDGELYPLELVSVDDSEFILKVMDKTPKK